MSPQCPLCLGSCPGTPPGLASNQQKGWAVPRAATLASGFVLLGLSPTPSRRPMPGPEQSRTRELGSGLERAALAWSGGPGSTTRTRRRPARPSTGRESRRLCHGDPQAPSLTAAWPDCPECRRPCAGPAVAPSRGRQGRQHPRPGVVCRLLRVLLPGLLLVTEQAPALSCLLRWPPRQHGVCPGSHEDLPAWMSAVPAHLSMSSAGSTGQQLAFRVSRCCSVLLGSEHLRFGVSGP